MDESVADMLYSILSERRAYRLRNAHRAEWVDHRGTQLTRETWAAQHVVDDWIIYHRNVSWIDRVWLGLK